MSNHSTQTPAAPIQPPGPGGVVSVVQLNQVTARRCDGRVASVLGKHATAADPYFFTADDGATYVVKRVATGTSDRTAFNEAMFARLARVIELRVPDVVAIEVPADLIADDIQLSAVGYPSGLHVGVARLPNGSFDLRGGALSKLGGNLQIENEGELPGTVVFSSWIEDCDHVGNAGNWMLEPRDNNKYVVWVIDFGHAMQEPDWDPARLQRLQDPATVRKIGPHPVAAPACALPNCFQLTLDKINALSQQKLADLANAVPPS